MVKCTTHEYNVDMFMYMYTATPHSVHVNVMLREKNVYTYTNITFLTIRSLMIYEFMCINA